VLAELGDVRALNPLCHLLRHADPHVRLSAVAALVQLGDTGAVSALVRLLEDRDDYVRAEAAHALERLHWQPHTPRECALLLLIRGAHAGGREELLPPLCDLLRSPSRAIRCDAAHALGELGRREALPALRAQLRPLAGEMDGEVRAALSAAIARIEGATGATRSLPRSLAADPLATECRPRTEASDPPAGRRPRAA
jgi:HEAT repeat protein